MRNERGQIYLDYNATTPVDSRVVDTMQTYWSENFGNPSSDLHSWGWNANFAVQDSRKKIAALLKCGASEIYFASGATEANNWVFHSLLQNKILSEVHIIASSVEHDSVRNTLLHWQKQGVQVDFVRVNSEGLLDLQDLKSKIRTNTRLISVIFGQNEIGTLQNISEISRFARERDILFHSDATQVVGKMEFDISDFDFLSFSSHKLYGPKGIGALYAHAKTTSLLPMILGGQQESGLRSGTEPVPQIVGFGKACELCAQELPSENSRLALLGKLLRKALLDKIPDLKLNGSLENRLPTNLHLTLPKIQRDVFLKKLSGLGISSSSACHSSSGISSTLSALGFSAEAAERSFRLSWGRFTDEGQILEAAEILANAWKASV